MPCSANLRGFRAEEGRATPAPWAVTSDFPASANATAAAVLFVVTAAGVTLQCVTNDWCVVCVCVYKCCNTASALLCFTHLLCIVTQQRQTQ